MKSCKGLPLGLEVVGRLLCGQPVAIWQSQAKQRSKGLSIFHSSADLLDCLQSSLDALDNKVGIKDCYLDLGLFPEDHWIPATVLIDMWVEQYKLDEDDDAIVNLHELSTRNMVNLVVMRFASWLLLSIYCNLNIHVLPIIYSSWLTNFIGTGYIFYSLRYSYYRGFSCCSL